MATTTTSTSTSASLPPASQYEDYARQQWLQALGYLNPALGQMSQFMDPALYGQYAGIAGLQGQQAFQETQAQPQLQQLMLQWQEAQKTGNTELMSQLQQQISGMPGGQQAFLQQQLYNQALQGSQGQMATLGPEAMAQIQQIGQAYETTGMNDVSRAREQALMQWQQNTAQRGLRGSDTPSQAAWAPVEAELARQTGNIGAGRGALEAQTQLQLQQQLPQQAAQLATYQQALAQSAQQNRSTLGTQSAAPYQNMFSGATTTGSAYSPFTQQLQNLRQTGATTTQTQTQNQAVPWTQALTSVGQGLAGLGNAAGFLQQAGSGIYNWLTA